VKSDVPLDFGVDGPGPTVLGLSVCLFPPADRFRQVDVNPFSFVIKEADVASVCDVCGKGPGFGMSVSHSHRRTHRRWNPNVQSVRALVAPGNRRRITVCTSCLKAGKVTRA
jgi:large subunit ribosomal protein L28